MIELLNEQFLIDLIPFVGLGGMIIMHDFGSGQTLTPVYCALLEDGTYAVRWNPGDDYTLFLDSAELKVKALEGARKIVQLDLATFTSEDAFDFTEEELGLIADIEA